MRTRFVGIGVIATLVAVLGLAAAGPSKSPKRTASDVPINPWARARLGVAALKISAELRAHLGAPGDRGVLVNAVKPDTPAAKAGIRVGDLVLSVDGDPVQSAQAITHALEDRKKGDAVEVELLRAGQRVRVSATMTDDPMITYPDLLGGQLMDNMDWDAILGDELRDEVRKRIDALERRLEKLERK